MDEPGTGWPGAGGRTGEPAAGPVIDYHFPVEVHTVGTLPPDERERLARTHLDRLDQELASRL
ncbi:hypothetical protein [Actinomadura fibrosa]|uniref:Uncharacterized protein n=1 Tax=Actinomadura fibrosa TaxID=111802 RepID=A0ABW2XMT1_9ACTN|nr:hypothetical protein [Actinomadura fibrosa]